MSAISGARQAGEILRHRHARPGPCAMCEARGYSVCSALADEDLAALADVRRRLEAAPGKVVVREGDPADDVFNVTHGAVKLYRTLADGRRAVIGFLFRGDFIGFGSCESHGFSAEALVPTRLCRFPRRRFRGLLDAFPAMERRLLCMASHEIAAAQEQMMLLGRMDARERLAAFLLGLSARAARRGEAPDPVMLPMTRTDIADFLGLTTETVSRVMTLLRRDAIVRLPRSGQVEILDPDRLRTIAGAA